MNMQLAVAPTIAAGGVLDVLDHQERKGYAPSGGLSYRSLCSFMEDIRNQPPWRRSADRCVDYYDGNQLDADTLQALARKGMGPLITNVIAPIINVVLGMEAKTRSDWRLTADDDRWQDVAEAKSAKLMEAERESRADRACSDGYAGQIKAGLGWVEVSRRNNPFDYPYRVQSVHRREIFWDWHDDDPMLTQSSYLVRKRFYDVDQAVAYFPKHKEILKAIFGDPLRYELLSEQMSAHLRQDLDHERGPSLDELDDWRMSDRQRLALYEVWYRQWVRGYVIRMPDGTPVELDVRNRMHLALLATRRVRPEQAVYSKMRMAIFAGPHRLHDCACRRNYFPYIPFWGYREDLTGVPYGLIRAMLSPQDEVNARVQKMYWLLGAKRVQADADALDLETNSVQDVLEEIARADAWVALNPHRANKQHAFVVDDNLQLSEQQFKLLQERKMAVQEVVGVFNALLGRDGGANSGVAIDSLVEQGTTALAEINDNYRYARRTVGERLVDLIDEDLIGSEVQVMVGEPGRRKTVVLNKTILNENTGQKVVINDVRQAKVKVALEDVPSTPSYRQQQLTMLAEVMKGMPPDLQAAIAPFYLEATSLQKRREMADAVRKAMGISEPRTPQEEKQMAEAAAEQADIQRRMVLADLMEREAKAEKLKAEAQAALREFDADPAGESVRSEYEQRLTEVQRNAQEQIDKLTAEVLTVRSTAGVREQKLLGELAKVNAAMAAGAKSQAAVVRAKEIDKEIAEINADKDRDVARLSAAGDGVVESMRKELESLRNELLKKIDTVETKAEQREAKREKVEKPAAPALDIGAIAQKVADQASKEIAAEVGKTIEAKQPPAGKQGRVVFEWGADGKLKGAQLVDDPKGKLVIERDKSGRASGAKRKD